MSACWVWSFTSYLEWVTREFQAKLERSLYVSTSVSSAYWNSWHSWPSEKEAHRIRVPWTWPFTCLMPILVPGCNLPRRLATLGSYFPAELLLSAFVLTSPEALIPHPNSPSHNTFSSVSGRESHFCLLCVGESGVEGQELVSGQSRETLIALFIQQICIIYPVPRAKTSVVREVVTS